MTVMPKLEDLTDQSFNPFELEKLSTGDCPDPYPRIHEMMREGTVRLGSFRDEFTDVPDVQLGHLPQAMVFGYDTVMKVLTDPETFTNREVFINSLG